MDPENRDLAINSASYNALPRMAQHLRLGDLLSLSGIIEHNHVRQALSGYEDRGLPLGQCLVVSGFLSETLLRAALDIQSLVNNRQLPLDMGVKVLACCSQESLSLAKAFEHTKVVQPEDHLSNKLGQLLVDANILDVESLEQYLESSRRTGLPLGHVLSYAGIISGELLEPALLGQQLVRRAAIKREQCINSIAAAFMREVELMKLPFNQSYQKSLHKQTPRLGEMLFEAELISDKQLFDALLYSLASGSPCGRVMCGAVPDARLHQVFGVPEVFVDAAVSMQEMIDCECLTPSESQDVFNLMKALDMPFLQALGQAGARSITENLAPLVVQLLIGAGVEKLRDANVYSDDLRGRINVNYNQGIEVARLLVQDLEIPEHYVYAALRAAVLIKQQKTALTMDDLLGALTLACRESIALDEVLVLINLRPRTRLRWP